MLYSLARPLLFRLDAETAHRMTLGALSAIDRVGLAGLAAGRAAPSPVRVMGLDFPNRVGLAAGLDKNGAHVDALARLGFGFIEVGTVTPRPQPGNPRPRLFRITPAQAIVNRMGFNNDGVDCMLRNLGRTAWRGILGINIGKNFDTPIERAHEDYVACLRRVYGHASYVVVNISSPNTAGLRSLQREGELERLLDAVMAERERLCSEHGRRVPVAVKIAPDIADEDLPGTARTIAGRGADAIIATNTTLSRSGVEGLEHAAEAGGLSGAPLRNRATAVIRILAAELGAKLPIIGVGGILCGADAEEKIRAGASLVQVYSGLIYRGPGLVAEVSRALARAPSGP